jgi:hypothetical protein
MSNEQLLLTKIKRRYLFLRVSETVLLSVTSFIFSFVAFHFLFDSILTCLLIALVTGLVTFIFRIYSLKLFRFSEGRIVTYLNHHYPQLEASADLLSSESAELTSLQLFQRAKVYHKLSSLEQDIRFPHQIIFVTIAFFLTLGIWFIAGRIDRSAPSSQRPENSFAGPIATEGGKKIVSLNKVSVTINPPSYTQRSASISSDLSLKVIEGSWVTWNFRFNGSPHDLVVIFSGKDSVNLKPQREAFQFQRPFTDGGFYQFIWTDLENKKHQSDYYPIEVTKDEAPHIAIENLAQFIELTLTDRLVVDLKATLSDDFGLKDSHIIATVSKGSGESVKFREETLRFTSPTLFSGKLTNASRSIDLIKLGLEPGDELYFYVEAFDNKMPLSNMARTETYFIAVQDTSSYEVAEGEGMGVDALPEYFRSQRQIIIDSEKILEEKKEKKITKELFNSKSNELGYDQKVLRLRYSQFMGDEEESPELEAAEHAGEEETVEDMMKRMGHEHDTENENNLVVEKPIDPNDEAAMLQQSIKTKLRIALTLMWDAELQLRMYQPDKSLPYQYKILKLLKEISNDSRVYVHRSGFDPPPLKEEKRLSGDLTEVKNSFNKKSASEVSSFPAIRQAVATIEKLLQTKNPEINKTSETILQKAGNELAGVAVQQPGNYLKTLSLIKSLLSNEIRPEQVRQALITIREAFWKALPTEMVSPTTKSNAMHPIDQKFIQQLEVLKHER